MIKNIKFTMKPWAHMPVRKHKTDAGLDFKSPIDTFIYPGAGVIIDTGIALEIPEGYYGELHSRSSMYRVGAVCDGVIDSSYRGDIGIMLLNVCNDILEIHKGERIAQLIILPCETGYELEKVQELSSTDRGAGGFGSTGK